MMPRTSHKERQEIEDKHGETSKLPIRNSKQNPNDQKAQNSKRARFGFRDGSSDSSFSFFSDFDIRISNFA
jgi:hypothetical protein